MRLALLASLLIASSPALAAEQPAQESAKPVKAKKICRESGSRSESRLRKRVCKTAAEWNDDRSGPSASELSRVGK